jgi:hypothetical protein
MSQKAMVLAVQAALFEMWRRRNARRLVQAQREREAR